MTMTSEAPSSLQKRANECAERGDFEGALRLFREALLLLSSFKEEEDNASSPRKRSGGSGSGSLVLSLSGREEGEEKARSPAAALLESIAQCELLLETPESRFRALEAAQRAVSIDPHWAEGHFTLGRAETAVRDFKAACKSFEIALSLEPEHEDASEELKIVRELARRRAAKANKHPRLEKVDAWSARLARKVSRAKCRRRPTWQEVDWQQHNLAARDLMAFGRDSLENIERVHLASDPHSFQDFGTKYQASSTPVLLEGAANHWPAMTSWTFQRFSNDFGEAKMVCDHRYGVRMRMSDFLDYLEQQQDDSPLYLFDHRFAERRSTRALLREYSVPVVFLDTGREPGAAAAQAQEEEHERGGKIKNLSQEGKVPVTTAAAAAATTRPTTANTTTTKTTTTTAEASSSPSSRRIFDLFEQLSEALRPPLKWLLIGSARSGSPIHKDPLGTSAWNALLTGSKLWVLFPPTVPPVQLRPPKGFEHNFPQDSASCWFLLWWRSLQERTKLWPATQRPIEFIQRPGDVVFVPSRWWHAVLNLEDTIAVTHNFCSRWNAADVWRCSAATHPILGRHLRAAFRTLWPDLHEQFEREPPRAQNGDDDEVSYLQEEQEEREEALPKRSLITSNSSSQTPNVKQNTDQLQHQLQHRDEDKSRQPSNLESRSSPRDAARTNHEHDDKGEAHQYINKLEKVKKTEEAATLSSSSDESDEQYSSWHRSVKRLRLQ